MFRPRIRCVARRPIAGGLIAALLLGATAAPGASSELQYGAAFGARLEDGLVMAGGGLFSARLPAFLAPEPLLLGSAPRQRALPDPRARRGYTIGENLHAFVDYNRARTFARAPSRDLRDKRYLDFSTDPDRDVLGLLMASSRRVSARSGKAERCRPSSPAPASTTR